MHKWERPTYIFFFERYRQYPGRVFFWVFVNPTINPWILEKICESLTKKYYQSITGICTGIWGSSRVVAKFVFEMDFNKWNRKKVVTSQISKKSQINGVNPMGFSWISTDSPLGQYSCSMRFVAPKTHSGLFK